MKQRLLARLVCALLALCLLSSLAAAQQVGPLPAPSRLVVQVSYLAGAKPAYAAVPAGAWYGRFERVHTVEPRAAADNVLAVDVKTRLDGERVEVKVGVHVGVRYFDRFVEVATYTAAPGETVTAGALEAFGVVPFVFKVLRVNDADAAPPVVVNKTQSIEAAVTQFTATPLPRAVVTLRNLSSKRVRAVEVDQVFRGARRATSMATEFKGKILLEPGGTYERKLWVTEGQSTGTDFTPESIESIVVATVVFDDYTFEGDIGPAAWVKAHDEGERVQLARVIQLIRSAHAARDVGTAEAPGRFRAAVAALGVAAPQASIDALLKSYPGFGGPAGRERIRPGVEFTMHRVRRDLLEEFDAFEKTFRAAPDDKSFKAWLKQKQTLSEGWLSRL